MIWLIGSKGMLGTELSLVFEHRGLAYTGTDRDIDITNPASLSAFVEQYAQLAAKFPAHKTPFTWIINCAAYTDVDKAEDNAEFCRKINTDGPANIAMIARNIGAKLLHISTDYVFNGKGTLPYREDDPTDPVGVYGLTKRDGEIKVFENNEASYIIRTAWLYGKHGNNFVHTMLRLMKERDTVSVVNDRRGSPTWANDLANTIADLIITADGGKTLPVGIYHFTNEGNITWFNFARDIYALSRKLGILKKDCKIKPCTSAEFPAKVSRPAYSVLDKDKIKSALGIIIPEWKTSLEKYLTLCES